MIRTIVFSSLLSLTFAMNALSAASSSSPGKTEEIKKVSNAFGHILAKNLTDNPGFSFDLEAVVAGIQEELKGQPSPMSEQDYETAMIEIQQACFESLSTKNLNKAEEFLQQNSQSNEVKEVIQGKLQYSILKEGSGEKVTEDNEPLIHYVGRYLDDTVFSSSEEEAPISLAFDDVIIGLKKGLVGAKEGEERRIYIHPELGFGQSDSSFPNSLIIFDIKVLKTNSVEEEKQS